MDPARHAAEITEAVGVALSSRQLDALAPTVHYGIGIVSGALYGAFRGRVDYLNAGRGSVSGLFLISDEPSRMQPTTALRGCDCIRRVCNQRPVSEYVVDKGGAAALALHDLNLWN